MCLRILVVTAMYPHPGHQGHGAFVMQQVEQLRLLKHQVDVLHFHGYRSKLEYFKAAIEVRRRTRIVKYDVVHAHYGLTGIAAVFRAATPLVITLHGSDVLIGRLQPMISRLACRFADAVVAVSKQIAARVPGEIIPCGVDLNLFQQIGRAGARKRLGLALDKKYVLFPFSPSRTVKRFDLATAAVNRLVAHGLNVELLTVSKVPNGEMPWYYSAADAMVLCSDSEGSPTSVKEALACNLPVVSTDVGDVREIGEGIAGFQVCAQTAESLADGLESILLGGPGLVCDGHAAMRRYSLEQTALAVVQVYRRAIEERSSRREKGCARPAGGRNQSGSPGLQYILEMQRRYGLSKHWKELLRSAVFALLRFSGLPLILRELVQRSKTTILVYHAMPAPVAERHFRALSARYNIIPLSAYLAWRKNKPAPPLPPRSVIITFDDGHKANYELKPLLEKQRVPITIFLCSGIVGTQAHYWWSHAKNPAEARALKALPDEQRAQVMLERGHVDTKEYETREALSWDEIAEMKSLVDFQSHGVFHPVLPACSDERARSEVFESKKTLEHRCGLNICALAYPNGDYSHREISLLRSAGYTCGLTLDPGFNDSATDSFCLRRIPLPDDAGISELIVKASGLWASLRNLRRIPGLSHSCGARPHGW